MSEHLAHNVNQNAEYVPPKGWRSETCWACRGSCIRMGLHEIRDCDICHGNGGWWKHEPSGVLAEYPGGPFLGREQPAPNDGSDAHESDQWRYQSECALCETDGHLHMHDCPNNPLRRADNDGSERAS